MDDDRKYLDESSKSALTDSSETVTRICEKAICNLPKMHKQWVVFDSQNKAFRADVRCVWNQTDIEQILEHSDKEMNRLFPEHQPWATLTVDPEINPVSHKPTPMMFHIYPPSNEKQLPHIDSFGKEHQDQNGSFRTMAHIMMISSGYLPKLFTVPLFF